MFPGIMEVSSIVLLQAGENLTKENLNKEKLKHSLYQIMSIHAYPLLIHEEDL